MSSERTRFEGKYVPVPEAGCWLWMAQLDKDGYGRFAPYHQNGKPAHRYSWQLHRGPIPAGQLVLHRCDVPSCVNPAHLFLGTQAENLADQQRKERQAGKPPRKTHCRRGHELTDNNLAWRLPSGYKSRQRYCVLCSREKGAQWRELHRQQINEYARRWHALHGRKR